MLHLWPDACRRAGGQAGWGANSSFMAGVQTAHSWRGCKQLMHGWGANSSCMTGVQTAHAWRGCKQLMHGGGANSSCMAGVQIARAWRCWAGHYWGAVAGGEGMQSGLWEGDSLAKSLAMPWTPHAWPHAGPPPTHTNTSLCTLIDTHTHTHTHARTHTHAHAHTHTEVSPPTSHHRPP